MSKSYSEDSSGRKQTDEKEEEGAGEGGRKGETINNC